MAASITVHLRIFKRPQLPCFSADLDETGIKMHGLLRSFIQNIEIIRVAVPFNSFLANSCLSEVFLKLESNFTFFLFITFANSLDQDQDQQNVCPYLDQETLDTLIVFLKEIFDKDSRRK